MIGRLIALLAILFISASMAVAGSDDAARLRDELRQLSGDIARATIERDRSGSGALQALISMRIEILKISSALIQQRVHALESGAKIETVPAQIAPDKSRATALEKEIRSLEDETNAKRLETVGSGGLIKGLQEMSIATGELTIAMLQKERLKAHYGIHWLPAAKLPSSEVAQPAASKGLLPNVSKSSANIETQLGEGKTLDVQLSKKRFVKRDWKRGISSDAVVFDFELRTQGLSKTTRALKGVVVFADLFGETQFRLRYTLNTPLNPGKPHIASDVGFEFNQFKDDHNWMRVTEVADMKAHFQIDEVLYADGTKEDYRSR